MGPIGDFTSATVVLIINIIVFPKLGESGVPLQLVPFKESSHAVRLVPNTLELNEIIDRLLDSIRRLSEIVNLNPLPIDGTRKHFSYGTSNRSVSAGFKINRGFLWGLYNLIRSGNAYIYNNEEDRIQVVTKLALNQLKIEYEQCNVTFDEVEGTGSVEGTVDKSYVDLQLTLRARQNNSLPLVFVCNGNADELSLTPGDILFTLVGTNVDWEFHSALSDSLANHFSRNVLPLLRNHLSGALESVARRDEQLCYSLVLCNSCEFYAADS